MKPIRSPLKFIIFFCERKMKRPLMVWMLNLDYLCYMQTYVSPSPLTKKRGGGGCELCWDTEAICSWTCGRRVSDETFDFVFAFFPPLHQLFCLNIKLCSFVKSKVENVNVTYNSALLLTSERKIEQSPECLTRFHPVVCFPLLLRFEVLSISCLHTIRLWLLPASGFMHSDASFHKAA